ncbi:MAG: hypothetical protein GXY36_09610 [Chloroflexi bacterium]|nr:hypothetical protein [Chloroflexota bacterium]
MLNWLRRNRIGIKWTILTALVLGVLGFLASQDVFDGLEGRVTSFMDTLAEYGIAGMFVIGLVSNSTLVIQVPYNLPMFSLVIYADSLLEVATLGAATGLGGGIGETLSYAVAHTLVRQVDDLESSALFRWTKRTIESHPRLIPIFVWMVSAVPLPDFFVIMPLAMINYSWRKIVIPMIAGKIFQNVAVAFLFRLATTRASSLVPRDISFDLTAIIAVTFMMIIGYQIDRARHTLGGPEEPGAAQHETGEATPVQ